MNRRLLVALLACCFAAFVALAGCTAQSNASDSSEESLEVSDMVEEEEPIISVYGEEVDADPVGVKNILVIGDDEWEGIPGHADMVCLLRIDFNNHSITEITIPRDTKAQLEDGGYAKLSWVLTTYGPEYLTRTAARIYNEPIDFYARVGFEDLEAMVDHFGGITVNLPYYIDYSFYTQDYPDVYIETGEQTLDSWEAMVASRSRKSYGEQYVLLPDMVRQYMCRQMLNQLMTMAYANPDGIEALFTLLQDHVETNLPLEAQVEWATTLASAGDIPVVQVTGPHAGGDDPELGGDWLVTPDPDGWAALHDAIELGGDVEQAAMSYAEPLYPYGIDPVIYSTIAVG